MIHQTNGNSVLLIWFGYGIGLKHSFNTEHRYLSKKNQGMSGKHGYLP
jgi:hypothetical protein